MAGCTRYRLERPHQVRGSTRGPADHGNSGVMTFVLSHQGKLYQKDLGPDTAKIVEAMTRYDPDSSWTEVPEEGEGSP